MSTSRRAPAQSAAGPTSRPSLAVPKVTVAAARTVLPPAGTVAPSTSIPLGTSTARTGQDRPSTGARRHRADPVCRRCRASRQVRGRTVRAAAPAVRRCSVRSQSTCMHLGRVDQHRLHAYASPRQPGARVEAVGAVVPAAHEQPHPCPVAGVEHVDDCVSQTGCGALHQCAGRQPCHQHLRRRTYVGDRVPADRTYQLRSALIRSVLTDHDG
jgi:hypothetical protein